MIEALFTAARLSALGLALVLAEVCIARGWQRWRVARSVSPPIKTLDGDRVLLFGLLLSGVVIFAFTVPVLYDTITFLNMPPRWPLASFISLWLLLPQEFLMISHLAYNRTYTLRWCALWIVFAHGLIFLVKDFG